MSKNKHIVIVGAGPGGLAAGMILAHRGFRVTVLEKQDEVGGRSRPLRLGDYTFDVGPTFLMMRFVLEDLFRDAGRRLEDYIETLPLDPMYRLCFDDRSIAVSANPDAMKAQLMDVFGNDGEGLDRFLQQEEQRFKKLYSFIQRDYTHLRSMLTADLVTTLPYLSVPLSVFQNLGRYFREEKLRMVFSFQSKYLGMSPWDCPALFTMLPWVEHKYGIHHVRGGLHRINQAMARVVAEHGGVIRTGTPVKSLQLEGREVKGVILDSGELIKADAVVVNADFGYAMTNLVKPGILKHYSPKKLEKKGFSCSTFMLYLGLAKQYPLDHHTVYFASDYKANVGDIFTRKILSTDFSFYIQNASITDPELAPVGKSALYILVPVPNNRSGIDWSREKNAFRDRVIEAVMRRTGFTDLQKQIEVERMISPDEWQQAENIHLGATFNLSHQFSQMLYWRPHNEFEELNGCYLVGGGTHPGSGLPTIYVSARLSSNLICKRFGLPVRALETPLCLNDPEGFEPA